MKEVYSIMSKRKRKPKDYYDLIKQPMYQVRPLMWKGREIPGYSVSNRGEVFNGMYQLNSFQIKGRNYVNIMIDGKQWTYRIDYMVAYTFLGMYEDAIRLMHLDNDIANDCVSNLMWFRKCDVMNRYKDLAIVEDDYSITEEWRPCLTEENPTLRYEVSNLGQIRDSNGKLIPIYNNHNYRVFYYTDNTPAKATKCKAVHVAVAEAFIPNPNHYTLVNHLDGNKMNDVVMNLEWATSSMNAEHAYLQNLNRSVRYTDEQIHTVCKLLSDGVSHVEIQLMTGVDRKTVSDIYRGRRWENISRQYTMPKKKWTAELKEKINGMVINGMKGHEIFKELGMPYDQAAISMYERTRRELKAAGKLK